MAADELIETLAHDLGNVLVPVKSRIDMPAAAPIAKTGLEMRDVEEGGAPSTGLSSWLPISIVVARRGCLRSNGNR